MSAASSSNSPRYEFLDALRGLAILGVLAVHCAIGTAGPFPLVRFAYAGEYGVQLFFMVSAFTIFLTLDRAAEKNDLSIRDFFIRRFFRILPMFWVGIILYSFLPGREVLEPVFYPGPFEYLLTAVLQHGWHPNSLNTVVPGGWTIGIEGTFYLIAPFLFVFVKTWQRALLFFIACLFFGEIANRALAMAVAEFQLFEGSPEKALMFFPIRWFPSQLPVFAGGILAYRIWRELPAKFFSRVNAWVLLSASAVVLISSVAGDRRLLLTEPVFFSLGFLLLILALGSSPLRILVNVFTRFLGKISYSFYLLHFLLLELAMHFIQTALPGRLAGLPKFAALFVLTLALTSPLAFFTWKFIETPFIKLGAAWIQRLKSRVPYGQASLSPE